MTSEGRPVTGAVELKSGDQQRYLLAVFWRRPALLVVVCVIASALSSQSQLVRQFQVARWSGDSIPVALLGTLPFLLGSAAVVIPLVVLFLLLYIGLAIPLGVRRMGRDRRTLTYAIDDAGIRTGDALGAELLLPWSNVSRAIVTKRMLLLRLKPRGWRYVILRGFSPEDVTRIREIASRKVAYTANPAR